MGFSRDEAVSIFAQKRKWTLWDVNPPNRLARQEEAQFRPFVAFFEGDGTMDLDSLISLILQTCAISASFVWLVDHFESDRLDISTSRQKMVQNLFCGRMMDLSFWTDLLPAVFVLDPLPRAAMFGRYVDDIICVLHRLIS